MTIGTKLYLGFGTLILMLCGVVLIGWIGVGRVNNGLQLTGYFGVVSDDVNHAIINGERAKTASALHIYGKEPKASETVTAQIAIVTEDVKSAINRLENAPYITEEHKDIIGKGQTVLTVAAAYNAFDTQYADLQKQRDARAVDFHSKYEKTGVILGEILKAVDAPYKERVVAESDEGDVPLHYFKMNKIARDCRGALTAFKIAYDAYQLAIGEEDGKKTHDAVWSRYAAYKATVKAFDTVQFEAEQLERIKQIRQIAESINGDLVFISETTDTQNKIVSQQTVKGAEFDKATSVFLEGVEGVYDEAESIGQQAADRSSVMVLIFGLVAIVFALLTAWGIARNIIPGIKNVSQQMTQIANTGDLSIKVEERFKNRRDEIGELANAFALMTSEFQGVEHLAKNLAEGDWAVEIAVRGENDAMNIHLGQMLNQMNELLHEVGDVVGKVADGTLELASASDSLSQGATESAASVEEISASVNEIGSQTQKNVNNAESATELANKANEAAAAGQDMMQKMIASMQQITTNASDVQRVVKVIDDISFQTNLLALNAAVEAARAGSHGKGFAVVAEEVRNLAARSAKAAAETTQMIDNNNKQIQNGADIVSQTAGTLTAIVDQATQVADLIGKIAAANKEQANAVNQVSHGLRQIESVTQQNSSNAEQTASTSNEMNDRAKQLQGLISKFHLRRK